MGGRSNRCLRGLRRIFCRRLGRLNKDMAGEGRIEPQQTQFPLGKKTCENYSRTRRLDPVLPAKSAVFWVFGFLISL